MTKKGNGKSNQIDTDWIEEALPTYFRCGGLDEVVNRFSELLDFTPPKWEKRFSLLYEIGKVAAAYSEETPEEELHELCQHPNFVVRSTAAWNLNCPEGGKTLATLNHLNMIENIYTKQDRWLDVKEIAAVLPQYFDVVLHTHSLTMAELREQGFCQELYFCERVHGKDLTTRELYKLCQHPNPVVRYVAEWKILAPLDR